MRPETGLLLYVGTVFVLGIVWNAAISYRAALGKDTPWPFSDGDTGEARYFGCLLILFFPIVFAGLGGYAILWGPTVWLPELAASFFKDRAARQREIDREIEAELRRSAEAAASKAKDGPFRDPPERCGACGQFKRAA